MGLGKSLFYHPLLLQHFCLASFLYWQRRGKKEDRGFFSAFSCFCKPSKYLHFLKYRWGIVGFFKLLMLLTVRATAGGKKWKEQLERDCGRVSLGSWQKEAQLKAELLPDLEEKMREKGVVLSKPNTLDPRQARVTAAQTVLWGSLCGALQIQCWQTDAERCFWALWTFNHPRKSSAAAVSDTTVLDGFGLQPNFQISETLSKLLLFLAFFKLERQKWLRLGLSQVPVAAFQLFWQLSY